MFVLFITILIILIFTIINNDVPCTLDTKNLYVNLDEKNLHINKSVHWATPLETIYSYTE